MKRTILVTITALLLAGTALHADRQGKGKGNKHRAPEAAPASAVSVSVSWGTRDIEVVRRYYAPKYRTAMPLGNPGDNGSGIRLGQSAGGTNVNASAGENAAGGADSGSAGAEAGQGGAPVGNAGASGADSGGAGAGGDTAGAGGESGQP